MDRPNELDQLLQQFCQLTDEAARQGFLQDHAAVLLTEAAEARLAGLVRSAADETQRRRLEACLQRLRARDQTRRDEPSPREQLFLAFMAARNAQDINDLILRLPEAALDDLERLAETRQAELADEEARAAVRQRLDDLRSLRRQVQAAFGERLPLLKRLAAWIRTDSWPASAAYLQRHAAELLTDAAGQTLQQLLADDPENPLLQQHRTLLQESRTLGVDRAYANRAERAAETALAPDQALADKLAAWINTADWGTSQTYLMQHKAQLLADEAVDLLTRLQRDNPEAVALSHHLVLLQRCREVGIKQAYRALQAAAETGQALQALRQVEDAESFEAAVAAHPALKELPVLEQLAAAAQQAHREGEPETARQFLGLLLPLFHMHGADQADAIDPAAQEQVIALHEAVLPAAETAAESGLTAGLRKSCSLALNRLGNHYAQEEAPTQAVETYTRAIAYAPQMALLYRNRAGEYLALQQYEAARRDLDRAAALEPEAARLPALWLALYLGLGDGPAMLPYARRLLAANPAEAARHFNLALALTLTGDRPAAGAAMRTYRQLCSDPEREQGRARLARLQEQQPAFAAAWQELAAILQDG